MNEVEVRELVPSEYKEWDLLVEKAQPGTLFHTSEWLDICRDVLSRDLRIYGCFKKGELVGGCPLFVKNFKVIMKVGSSTCNMTDYCGPLIKECSSSKKSKTVHETYEVLNALREFFYRQGFDSIHLKFSPGLKDVRPFTWNDWDSKVHYTYYLDLKENIDKNISRTIRKDLKSAAEAGLETRIMNDPGIYYGLFSKVYEKQKLEPPVPREFFERVLNLIRKKDIGYMLVSETPDGEAVAAHLTLYGKKSAVTWSTARDPSFSQRGSNALLYYNEFLDLKSRNFEYMNVMSANVPKFADFIRGFSPKLMPYYSVTLKSKKYSILKNLYELTTETLKL
jgi:CelD/BcsL family acetyltransferase involved in cellulose biosynthesis